MEGGGKGRLDRKSRDRDGQAQLARQVCLLAGSLAAHAGRLGRRELQGQRRVEESESQSQIHPQTTSRAPPAHPTADLPVHFC